MDTKTKLLLRNCRLVDPMSGTVAVTDILIVDGRIQQLGRNIRIREIETWDLTGKYVAPGFIDLHCHLREPGREDEETIQTGTWAALAGGFTTVCCMPNTEPPVDNATAVRAILSEAVRVAQARVLVIGAATKGRAGKELAEIGTMKDAGIVAVSDDGAPIADAAMMRRVLEYTKAFDLPVISHCEEPALSSAGVMHEGKVSARLGLPGIPACAEEVMVMRDIMLTEFTGGRLHIAHVSTRGSVELIRQAKARGVLVTCETCPHYFALTDEVLVSFDSNCKVNPPLRTADDVAAIKEGLRDGTIDAIATDHAPHTTAEKEVEFEKAPFGMIGLETAFALGIMELVQPGVLELSEYIARLTAGPAQVLKRSCGVAVGSEADLVIFDPEASWRYTPENARSAARNSPFIGKELTGKILGVVIGNRVARFQ